MEQEKTNIAELLKGTPKGTMLYSPICGECKLSNPCNDDGFIEVLDVDNETQEFFNDGRFCREGEPLLFPSEEVRDWGCFRVKYINLTSDYEQNGKLIDLFKGVKNEKSKGTYARYCSNEDVNKIIYLNSVDNCIYEDEDSPEEAAAIYNYILSTGTELKLEEEQPKFKVGDVVKVDSDILGNNVIGAVESTEHYGYKNDRFRLWVVDGGKAGSIDIPIEDTSRLATPEEITKWNREVLEPNHLHYSKSKRKIIHWFLPFDKVLVRSDDAYNPWEISFFGWYDEDSDYPYTCINGRGLKECLPYNDKTAKLIGTTDDYKEEQE